MRRTFIWAMVFSIAVAQIAPGQMVVDRIAARVEGDVILLSDVRTLSRYQELVDGKSESDAQILNRLIDQWIVRNEADAARFPRPTDAEVSRALERLLGAYDSLDDYQMHKTRAGLSDAAVQKMLTDQLYLSKYLDSRFRPAIRVSDQDIQQFYEEAVVSRAKARKQQAPTLEASREYIQEALIQRGINQQADRWLQESRARLHVEKYPSEGAK